MCYDSWKLASPPEPSESDLCRHDELSWDCTRCIESQEDQADWLYEDDKVESKHNEP